MLTQEQRAELVARLRRGQEAGASERIGRRSREMFLP